MDVILHIGAHRTGTTTFQRFMQANRAHLRGQGIGYWGPGKTRAGLFRGLMRAPHRITPEDEHLAARTRGRIALQVTDLEAEGTHTLIVSEENMLGGMWANVEAARLYSDAGERLARIATAFSPHPVRVGLAIRSYDRHWASQLAHSVKRGQGLPDAGALEAIATQPVRWTRIIRQVAAAFPQAEVVVWPFEALIGLPELQLGALFGQAIQGPFQARREWHNSSLSVQDLRKLIHDEGVPDAALARMGNGVGRWHPFTNTQTALMRAAYAQDLAWLRGGADGLATYIDSPEAIAGATGPRRGQHDDERQKRMG